ncbi:MAG TPA: TetR/AcrR family transcriptional regulator, partial [Rhodanobacteraceae bacterium]|nr:TetR/AcrR family transcriptional regulator [Rhodanobacteraceae bacterium]
MVATATKLEPKGRLTAAHWEQAALDTLSESGLGAVAVESLARRLGVTKG